jgi:hypothetical protein
MARLGATFSRISAFLQRLEATVKGEIFVLQLHHPVAFPVTEKLSVSAPSEWFLCSCKTTRGKSSYNSDAMRRFYSLLANCLNNHRRPAAKIEKVA